MSRCKTKTMIVSRLRPVHPQLTSLTLDGTVLKEYADLVIFWVMFDAKMTFESSTFALFPVLQLRSLVSRESPDRYFMTGRFL